MKFPFRRVNIDFVKSMPIHIADPRELTISTIGQLNDQQIVTWAGMYALARDVYSVKKGEKPTEFLGFVKATGLILNDMDGKKIDIQKELEEVQKN